MAKIMKLDKAREAMIIKEVLKLMEEELFENGTMYGLTTHQINALSEQATFYAEKEKVPVRSYLPISATRH